MRRSSLNTASQIADIHLSESWLPEALWGTRLHLVLAAGLLLTFVLAGPEMQGAWLPLTTISLHWVALLALSIWLGRVLYLACVLAPVTHVIESGERTQTIIEFLPTIKPPIVQALLALALYEIFLAETQVTRSIIFSDFLTHPFGWVLMAEVGLAGLLILLAVYQQRFVLPHLARMTWLAVRGTVMSVRGGMDVSRALQISQNERLALADLASRRLIQTLYAQIALGLLLLLGLMLTSLLVFPLAG